ncbi:MAG: hypothetical protein EXR07_21180 [Acetobacteraceae bacterium]|nr:hypothetical protein [Acetobacteraceae bacterium]
MIGRRALLAGGAALTAVPANAALPPNLHFQVLRNGSPIGKHVIDFRQDGASQIATIAVDIVVRLGPIVLYRYELRASEAWRDGRFQTLECETNDNGTRISLKARLAADRVTVDVAGKPPVALAATAMPLTHWSHLCMERPLFNPEDGEAIDSRVVVRGEEMVPLADGRSVRATHYSLVGKVALDSWYDAARTWTSLSSIGTDGSRIEYRRAG